MSNQILFADILAKKMQRNPIPAPTSEVHSVDEMISPKFIQVFGVGSLHHRCKGLSIYGVA